MSAPSDRPILTVRSTILPSHWAAGRGGSHPPLALSFFPRTEHPHQPVAQLVAPIVPMVPVPGALEENIDAAFAQEICKSAVLFGQPLEFARRDEGAGSRHLGRAAQGPHEARDAMEDRMRPPLELALVENEGPR